MDYRTQGKLLQVVDTDDLPEYPISSSDRLDSHYFLQWNLKRWRGSDFRKKCDPEVGWYGFQLFCLAHDGSPVGTLSCDEEILAVDLNLSLEKWRALMARKITPLHGWYPVMCDNGEKRLAHKVVTEVMENALRGHREYVASNEEKAIAARRSRLKTSLKACNCSDALLADEFAVAWMDDWLLENHIGQRRMPQFQHSISRALRAAYAEGILGDRTPPH